MNKILNKKISVTRQYAKKIIHMDSNIQTKNKLMLKLKMQLDTNVIQWLFQEKQSF